jgi:hypothetical protein
MSKIVPLKDRPATMAQLLRSYRDAVERTTRWSDMGTHGDGMLDKAKGLEREALKALKAGIKAGVE